MTAEEAQRQRKLKHLRIRRVKRLLRPLPRRTNLHRYPFIRRFAGTARKRLYLWSFRSQHAIPSIYCGFVLSFLPLYGIQLPLSFVLALMLRSNLPILFGLQLVTNPFTALPIYYANYQIGKILLELVGFTVMPLRGEQIMALIKQLFSTQWFDNIARIATAFGVTSLGGVVVATFFAVVCAALYRFLAKRSAIHYTHLVERIQDKRLSASKSRHEP